MLKKAAIGIVAALASGAVMANSEVTVYTAFESDMLRNYERAFNAQYPDTKINWVRDSTGVVTAKLLAEKNNPQADVVWGLAATSLMVLDNEKMLEPYAPANLSALSPAFRDSNETPHWIGMNAWIAGICFNTVEAEKHGLEMPKTWEDLTKPEYKGHVVMPNPNSSGTGFLDVAAWLQTFGEEKGWAYMDKLHNNIDRYTHSGSAPCQLAATGETTMGVSFAFRGANLKSQGAPIELIFPEEGLGWDMEAAAKIKGAKNPEEAKQILDFAATLEANQLYNKGYAVVAIPGVAKPVKHFPENPETLMIENDFAWTAANRESILSEWAERYDGKTEK
ncbi:putative 2-aminoethylphosphonate ABC transporter substrate-binding protein [Photobacterium sanctipauli]|uniref:Putative 2-aminoethylphosphonate ABC transporter substrate-binding protein n=1 Tax=Photobacterium sanctipauli TaxID=1342794 RepID=A0A2T3NUC3_9GAMM|nr:putative 2-aminoethylphosphonate ABC transporter substrate-binding protein [Photobacterium sanctipauli]PSW19857.1 putative 2-aminoethylphosphonate ABC transporter substrate-binding protein [Photobacterium sanctipauli]